MLEKTEKLVDCGAAAAPAPARRAVARHVGIIMDGNGRWALERGLPRTAGHRAGVEALRGVVKAAPELGIDVLTCYAFSTENWKRPKDEVDTLMLLLLEYCRLEAQTLYENGVRVSAIGRIDELPAPQRDEIRRVEALTRNNSRLILNLAVNYGGQAELVDAFRKMAREVLAGRLSPDAIDAAQVEAHLYTAGLPAPDLVIRTAGEMRLSNFLLWQSAYSEIWVTDVYWPDFKRQHLEQALRDFANRERRFGAV